jgi:hypothetical protein
MIILSLPGVPAERFASARDAIVRLAGFVTPREWQQLKLNLGDQIRREMPVVVDLHGPGEDPKVMAPVLTKGE